ncbi:hypothetical protein QW180_31475 [Vibrio sinaloensis]|nr:hypothetical protein [Vibrio sinaloensis]
MTSIKKNDQALTLRQKSFLELTQTPVLKFFIDDTASNQTPDTSSYSRMIAVELLNQYLTNMLSVASQSLANTNNSHDDIALITKDIDNAKRFTAGLADKAIEALNNRNQLINTKRHASEKNIKRTGIETRPNLPYGN